MKVSITAPDGPRIFKSKKEYPHPMLKAFQIRIAHLFKIPYKREDYRSRSNTINWLLQDGRWNQYKHLYRYVEFRDPEIFFTGPLMFGKSEGGHRVYDNGTISDLFVHPDPTKEGGIRRRAPKTYRKEQENHVDSPIESPQSEPPATQERPSVLDSSSDNDFNEFVNPDDQPTTGSSFTENQPTTGSPIIEDQFNTDFSFIEDQLSNSDLHFPDNPF
ncbi:hypothetical protein TVAG_083510 [Trichomonas vaginalis G3]|uniref:Uncharacterized protein n=1 Tax=Trichomonas vaginalis (strain ATCC PRA-98 / G3) TaxID=412133 RepID=A2DM78_TRIV3|nr:hypothetical protein TVAGG3_0983810 [Trichomonas vaginalis G3]EAY18498.1 hypothetical protein TVAG_083510 [Trichomonas vaginalis G3]KAI5489513.1 hypothetical protein TVAGG3_0983810 [Trichomonas vaginalis G3]|eukprot:XP_001579484.1 hypothetical protein [Trichomonas vaginalis G3]